jgi:butyrate response factor 1
MTSAYAYLQVRRAHSLDLSPKSPPEPFLPWAAARAEDSRVLGEYGARGEYPESSLGEYHAQSMAQNSLYKTELCRSWEETGSCRYGGKCQFAHGRDELRPVVRHPKYKTEVCRTYAQNGACPYGARCRFIHHRAPQRSACGTLIASAHNVVPTDWIPETRCGGSGNGFAEHSAAPRRSFEGAKDVARVHREEGKTGSDSDSPGDAPRGLRRLPVFSSICGKEEPARGAAAAAAAAAAAVDAMDVCIGARADGDGADADDGGNLELSRIARDVALRATDENVKDEALAFCADRRDSARATASAVLGNAEGCVPGRYDIGARVSFGTA